MNKKYIAIASVQVCFIVVAFLIFYFDYVSYKDLDSIKCENETLKEEIGSLNREYIEMTEKKDYQMEEENVEKESTALTTYENVEPIWDSNESIANVCYYYPSLRGLEEYQKELEEKLEGLEEEIKEYEETKSDWNTKIAELEK